jgi:uncharacterized protein
MSIPLVTADANLLASGALRSRLNAAPVQFIDSWAASQFTLILSDHLLDELDRTFNNPYFLQRLGQDDREDFRRLLRRRAIIIPLTMNVAGVATHTEDDLILATALSGNADFLVTGDHKLLSLKGYRGLTIVSARAFLSILPGLSTEGDG